MSFRVQHGVMADNESQLLRSLVRSSLTPPAVAAELAAALDSVNWSRLLWRGRQQGVLATLHEVLGRSEFAARCPLETGRQLHAFHEVQHLCHPARLREACQVHDLFAENKIPDMMVDPWMLIDPPRGNLDTASVATLHCLVPEPEKKRAQALLLEAGHPAESSPEELLYPGRFPVVLNARMHPEAVAHVWEKPESIAIAGRKFLRPRPEQRLPIWATRFRRWSPMSLSAAREVIQFTRLITPEAWPGFWAEAEAFGSSAVLRQAIAASHAELGMPLPPGCVIETTAENPQSPASSPNVRAPETIVAPFLPTPPAVLQRMLALAETGRDDQVCDLGCGDGRIAIMAARDFGAHASGIDRDPQRIAEATAEAARAGVHAHTRFTTGDLFQADISHATVITIYLLPAVMLALQRKLRRETRAGARIVAHDYAFPDWPPEKVEFVRTGPMKISQLYLWRVP